MQVMKKICGFFCIVGLAGCTGIPSDSLVGQDRNAVVRVMGQPHSEIIGEQTKVLVYPKGPAGKGTFFIELNNSEQVVRWQDVLNYTNFNKIKAGMHVKEMEKIIGPSLWRWSVAKDNQTVFNYPFYNSMCQIFQVAVLPSGIVAEVGYGFAPECESFGD